MFRNFLTIGGWTLASRVLGFIRDMLIAALLGTTTAGQAFVIANRLPNMFRALFGEGAFNSAFVPELSGLMASEGKEAATRFADEAIAVMAFWLGLLTVLGEIFMPQLTAVLAPGYLSDPDKFALTVDLGRITFPYLLLICLAALFSGVLNTLHRFTAAAAAPMLYNTVAILALVLLRTYLGASYALAWGISFSGVIQLILLVWAVRRAGMRVTLPRPRLTPQVKLLLRRMTPGLLSAGANQINQSVDVIIASILPGGVAAILYYAARLYQLPLGIIGVAVGTAILPVLSRQVRNSQPAEAIATLNRGLEFALFLTIPAALALAVSAQPIVRVLYVRGEFSHEDGVLTGQSLLAYAPGVVAFVLLKVLQPGFFARGDTKTPMRVTMATLVLNLCLNAVFYFVGFAHIGPPLAGSLAAVVNVGWLSFLLMRHGYLMPDAQLWRRLPRMVGAALAMALALALLQGPLFAHADAMRGMRYVALAALVLGGLGVYGMAGQVLGAFDMRDMRRVLARRGAG